MATNDEIMQQFLATQKQPKPNAMQAIGAGLSGFAAPFLGQTWTNPLAKTISSGGADDIMKLMLMKQMMQGNPEDVLSSEPKTPSSGKSGGAYSDILSDQGIQPRQPDPFATFGGKYDPAVDKVREAQMMAPLKEKEKRLESELKTEEKRKEKFDQSATNFAKTTQLFSGIVSQIKGQQEEQGGLGLIPGLKGKFKVALKDPEFSRTASAFGQRAETAFALNSILTGQNRVIKSIYETIVKSLPGEFDTEETSAAKIAQSVTNAYRLQKSLVSAGLTPDVLEKMSKSELDNIDVSGLTTTVALSPEESSYLEGVITQILSSPIAKKRTFSSTDKNTMKTPSGVQFTFVEKK